MQTIDKNLYKQAVDAFGTPAQIIVAIEECSELIKELSKTLRQKCDIDNISEEMADVQIMLEQLKIIFNNEHSVNMWIMNKNCRIAELVEENKQYIRNMVGCQNADKIRK